MYVLIMQSCNMTLWKQRKLTIQSFMHGMNGLTLSGNEIQLQDEYMCVAQEEDNKKGYNILYACKEYHQKCQLILPED